MFNRGGPIPILLFAESILGIRPYDWQCHILLNYEAGNPTAAACANFTGKTSTVFPIAALWTLYSFPRARLMYLSATSAQVKNQFFASLERFRQRLDRGIASSGLTAADLRLVILMSNRPIDGRIF
jgi:hypothetical protein